ncbi:MAG TPA: M12 family metallo-peptidase [Phycisphaerae bacterium]|nr:M12 family metallo-peptidase [Phycisphaerae bacterium]
MRYITANGPRRFLVVLTAAIPLFLAADDSAAEPRDASFRTSAVDTNVQRIEIDAANFGDLKSGPPIRRLAWPMPNGQIAQLAVERFSVIGPSFRLVEATPQGETPLPVPDVVIFRGQIENERETHVFLALCANGTGNGYIDRSGERFFIATARDTAGRIAPGALTIHRAPKVQDEPGAGIACGVELSHNRRHKGAAPRGGTVTDQGARMAKLAIDADQAFVQLFPDSAAAGAYAVQLAAATADIYERDLNLRLRLDFVRLWPAGGAPFAATDLSGFADYWINNENPDLYNFVHLYSGSRATSYAGIAYVGGTCSAGRTYGISAFLNGTFPPSVGPPDLDNWDVIVTTHEMGHNAGTFHTHDGYSPTIDDCGNGVPSRGTIMSYCHTHPGGVLNIDMWMHREVEDVIEADFQFGGCFEYDCNGNNVADATDIADLTSDDVNSDGIPDECQDCNSNTILDPIEIIGGAADVNGNGIPDSCEPDCNFNGVPDPYECDLDPIIDQDGNNTPDECQADCNNNTVPDFLDVRPAGGFADLDRNNVPDVCQDCDNNGVTDWLDMGRGENLYVAAQSDYVREYFATSGYPIQNLAAGVVVDPHDCVFGADRQLYVASYTNDRIVRINVDTGATSIFVASGSGGLDGPASLVFGPNGNLFVASRLTSSVIQYNGATGALVGTFVTAGLGGLSQPYGLTFGPNGNLFVTSGNHTVIQYNGATGALVGTFVTAGSGSLSGPRGLTFLPNGDLVVASFSNSRLLRYNGATGASLGQFNNGPTMEGAWGVRVGPDGNVYAVRSTGTIRVQEYTVSGLYLRSFVRADPPLISPTGLAFRPGRLNDCNNNLVLDACEAPIVTLTPTTLSSTVVNRTYSKTITASGGTGDYNFVVTAGALPAGLTLSPTGVLSGTSTSGGTYNFTITAMDTGGCTGSRAYTIVVRVKALEPI